MQIAGLQKTTLLDYPGHVAATIFLSGCNFRCPFCHNMNIVLPFSDGPMISKEELMTFLNKRKEILDGVCITGGEPTLHSDLEELIRRIKELGLRVKLDTNGTKPEVVAHLLDEHLLDYVAMDIKGSRGIFEMITGAPVSCFDKVIETIRLLINSEVAYEFRTTIIEEYHTMDEIRKIGELISGAKHYYLQSFVDSEYVPDHTLHACNKEKLIEMKEYLSTYIDDVEIRGVE